MPAAVWRTSPARSISRWETICASVGFSRSVGRKNWVERMWLGILGESAGLRELGGEFRQWAGPCLWPWIGAKMQPPWALRPGTRGLDQGPNGKRRRRRGISGIVQSLAAVWPAALAGEMSQSQM